MTLPISLTCKTQEPSRTRTLRGTRGTSTGEGLRRPWQRRRRGEAASLDPWLLDEAAAPSADAGAGGRPVLGRRPHTRHVGGVPWGLRPMWLSWDHSGSSLLPGPACPRPEQASLSAPSSCLAPPLLPPHLSFLSHLTQKSQFLWWLVGGGDVREGVPACSPSSPPPQPPSCLEVPLG